MQVIRCVTTMTEERERVIQMVIDYRKKRRLQKWSAIWSGILGVSLILVVLYIFFFAWPTVV